jgi:hypothetical protein
MHRRISSSSRNEQCPSLLPRNMGGTTNQMVSLDNNQFGVTGPIVRESDDLVADRDVPDRASDCLDDAGKVATLSRWECSGPLLGEGTLADRGLSRVDSSRLHPDDDLFRSRHRSVDLDDTKDVYSAVSVKLHRTRHWLSLCHSCSQHPRSKLTIRQRSRVLQEWPPTAIRLHPVDLTSGWDDED